MTTGLPAELSLLNPNLNPDLNPDPDPNPNPNPNPTVNPRIALAQAGVDTNSPQFQAASQICERLYPLPSRGASQGGGS
jgi:hypothetical protein